MRGTPKLSKRAGSPFWYITFSQGRRSKRYSTGTADRKQAERVLAQYLLERQKPQLQDDDEIKVIDMLERYEIKKAEDATVGYHMRHLKPFFEDMALSQINNQTIRSYTAKRLAQKTKQGKRDGNRFVSSGTVRRELDTFSAALGYAHTEGYIKSVPHIEKPEPSAPRDRWLTYDEAGKLLAAAADNKRLLAFIEIAMNTAARPSSIIELKWFQVDMEKRLIHFNPEGRKQTKKHRPSVSMNDNLFAVFKAARTRTKSEYVLGGIKSIKQQFKRACDRAGIKGVTPYTLRHTAITWAIRDGHSLALAGQLAGHRDPRTTMRYAKHDPSFTSEIVSSLATGAQLAHKVAKNIKNTQNASDKKVVKQ